MIAKSNTDLSNSDDDSNTDTESDTYSDHNYNEDMDQMAALLVKSFKKMVYKNFNKGRIFSRKDDCRKIRAEKKQALISRMRNWDDSSDSDDGVNYASMAKDDVEANNTELKQKLLFIRVSKISKIGVITDTKVKLNKVQIKTIKFNPSANIVKSIHEEVNIGSMTQKQLKQKLKDLHMKDKRKRSRKNRNDKGDRRNALVLDSGCSGHMTGYKSMLSEFEEKAGPSVSYGDGNYGKILGYGKIQIKNVIIENVALVAGLKHNLISVSQICDKGYHVNFYEEHCEIVSKSDVKIALTDISYGSLYVAKKAKQRKTSFKRKTESSILEPYHLLHIDLFGPLNVMSIAKKRKGEEALQDADWVTTM
ncbi:hypothetical protein AgCh_001445 [Apium graveolens]